jgi:nuclear transport factor 2 (NTF2) superfamily protein
MRLIDADALKEIYSGNGTFTEAHVRTAIDEMTTASPWRRVEEELPKQGEWVLVVSRFARMRIDFMDSKGRWYRTCGVTHWMPLPEPPKEEEHGN